MPDRKRIIDALAASDGILEFRQIGTKRFVPACPRPFVEPNVHSSIFKLVCQPFGGRHSIVKKDIQISGLRQESPSFENRSYNGSR